MKRATALEKKAATVPLRIDSEDPEGAAHSEKADRQRRTEKHPRASSEPSLRPFFFLIALVRPESCTRQSRWFEEAEGKVTIDAHHEDKQMQGCSVRHIDTVYLTLYTRT